MPHDDIQHGAFFLGLEMSSPITRTHPTIDKNLKLLIQKHGVSIRKLASEIGMNHSCIWEWVRGLRRPNVDWRLKAIADYFDVEVGELLFEDLEEKKPRQFGVIDPSQVKHWSEVEE